MALLPPSESVVMAPTFRLKQLTRSIGPVAPTPAPACPVRPAASVWILATLPAVSVQNRVVRTVVSAGPITVSEKTSSLVPEQYATTKSMLRTFLQPLAKVTAVRLRAVMSASAIVPLDVPMYIVR